MDNIEYEEGYFKLKKSNEELTILVTKVLNDLRESKLSTKNEKFKNAALATKIQNLTSENLNLSRECDEQQKLINNSNQELEYLKTYSKAIEGVAENYCGQNITTQNKYNKLKRQSTLFFNSLAEQGTIVDVDFPDSLDSPDDCRTPTPVIQIEEIRKNHMEIMEIEKQRYNSLKADHDGLKDEISKLGSKIEELNVKIEDKENQLTKSNEEMGILVQSYENFKEDHEKMLTLFKPFLQMRAENKDLRRTSALLLNNIGPDERYLEFVKIIEELKTEIIQRDEKILKFESQINENNTSIALVELSTVKSELDELSEKFTEVCKERDTLKHENRILIEQKGGPGIPPPPPPPPNAPPPPPSNKIMNIFKSKKSKTNEASVASPNKSNPQDQKVFDLMKELERRLVDRVKTKLNEDTQKPNSFVKQAVSVDQPDSCSPTKIKLRSKSVPSIVIAKEENNELLLKFKKFKVTPIDEND